MQRRGVCLMRSRIQPIRNMLMLAAQTLRLMVGVGDYEVYRKHMQQHHPELPCLGHAEWHRARMEARYGAGKGGAVKRCPC